MLCQYCTTRSFVCYIKKSPHCAAGCFGCNVTVCPYCNTSCFGCNVMVCPHCTTECSVTVCIDAAIKYVGSYVAGSVHCIVGMFVEIM